MRITRDTLLKLAQETAERAARRQRDLICIFLIGSVLGEDPLLGGSTDIDLVFIHDATPPIPREVQRLSDEVTLDIAHLGAAAFQQPRRLRHDPWLGYALWNHPQVLYDLRHWFEFTQAAATAQFNQPENVLERAQSLATMARRSWLELNESPDPAPLSAQWRILQILEAAANAVACLSGPPLPLRRLLLEFPQRAAALARPGLAAGLVDLLGGEEAARQGVQQARAAWLETLQALGECEAPPPHLSAPRRAYYQRAVEAMAEEHPAAAWWILWRTWTRALLALPEDSPHHRAWAQTAAEVGLDLDAGERTLAALDAYLDTVEETLEQWGQQHGALG